MQELTQVAQVCRLHGAWMPPRSRGRGWSRPEGVGGKSGGRKLCLVSPSGGFYFFKFGVPKPISEWVHFGEAISV